MKPNNLPHGLEVLRGIPQSTPASSGSMCVVVRSPNTKDALSSVQKIFLFLIFCAQRGREAGASRVRKTSPKDFTRDN